MDNININIVENPIEVDVEVIENESTLVSIVENIIDVSIDIQELGDTAQINVNEQVSEVDIDVLEGTALIEHIELELKIRGSVQRYKEFTYTGDNISKIDIYTDSSKTTHIYECILTYTGDDLTEMSVERVSDGFTYLKEFTYDSNGNILNVNII